MLHLSAAGPLVWATMALTGAFAGAAGAQNHDHMGEEGMTHYRLFIGDHAEGVVRAIDLESAADAGTFEITQSPALTASASGRSVLAVQGDAGTVAVIATGITVEDHGDHADISVIDAALLPATVSGTRPAHVVEGSGIIAIFDDGSGEVTVFPETDLTSDRFAPVTVPTGAAHHGLAAPMGDYLVVSVPDEDPTAPRVGLRVIDAAGNAVDGIVECPGVHGQAQSARVFAFGCQDGIVLATPGAGEEPPTLEHVATGHLGEGNVSALKGGKTMQFFLGNFGPDAVVVIEPGGDDPFTLVPLPTRRVDFVLDPALPRNAYIFTEDGQLHLLDILSGAITQSVQVTEPYSMDGHWRDARPRLAVAGDHIVITDPDEGLLRVVSTTTLTEERTIAVAGTPYTIVAVGGSGATH